MTKVRKCRKCGNNAAPNWFWCPTCWGQRSKINEALVPIDRGRRVGVQGTRG